MDGIVAVFIAAIAAVLAFGGYQLYLLEGAVGCWIVGCVLFVTFVVYYGYKRMIFLQNAPDWFEEAIDSDKWEVDVSRCPRQVREIANYGPFIDVDEVIPYFVLVNARGIRLYLSRVAIDERHFCDGYFGGFIYQNHLSMEDRLVNEKYSKYVDMLMKHRCKMAKIYDE